MKQNWPPDYPPKSVVLRKLNPYWKTLCKLLPINIIITMLFGGLQANQFQSALFLLAASTGAYLLLLLVDSVTLSKAPEQYRHVLVHKKIIAEKPAPDTQHTS